MKKRKQVNKFKKTNPGQIPVYEENIPDELKKINQWCCWKWVFKNGKQTKPPCDTSGTIGNHLNFNYSFKEVLKAYENNKDIAGIGFSLRDSDNISGIDIDGCIDKKGKLSKDAKKIIKECDSYTEISPSGKGIRIFGKGKPETKGNKQDSNIEVYHKDRYLTVTGRIYE